MSDLTRFPSDVATFDALAGQVEQVVETGLRLPALPWRRRGAANVDVCQYSHAIEGAFGPVLESLAAFHGDEVVTTLVLEPAPRYYREFYGRFPVFSLPRQELAESFWDCVSLEPDGDPTGAVTHTANVVAATGDSGTWAVWAERSWDLAIVLSGASSGPWLSRGVEFVPVESALAGFTEPDFKTPLSPTVRSTFLANYQSGAGPA